MVFLGDKMKNLIRFSITKGLLHHTIEFVFYLQKDSLIWFAVYKDHSGNHV